MHGGYLKRKVYVNYEYTIGIQSVLEYATVTLQLVSIRFKTIIQHYLANCGIVFDTGIVKQYSIIVTIWSIV